MSLVPGAFLFLLLAPAAAQTAFLQEPTGTNGTHAVASDIRVIHRSTNGGGAEEATPGMVLVSGGKVLIGTPSDQVETLGQRDIIQMTDILAETPRHTAEVDAFLIDLTEVTNLQWQEFLDTTGRKPTATLIEYGWPGGKFPEGQEYYPITNVNILELRQFLRWSGKRLPTEAEWTRAARGDDGRAYPWGETWDAKRCQSGMNVPQVPLAVGTFPAGASPCGALDMLGNVFEWVDSPFSAYPDFKPLEYGRGKKTSTLVPEFNSSKLVIKGGAYTTPKQITRIDVRLGQNKVDSDSAIGFRAARSTKAGVDAIRNALQILVPPFFHDVGLDEGDVFATETTSYDATRKVVTGYRYVAFAHRAPTLGLAWSKLYKEAREEFVPLGVLATSETLRMPDMGIDVFPAGEYTLHFKAEGESKAWKDKQAALKDAAKAARKNGSKRSKDDEPPADPAEGGEVEGGPGPAAAAPWPGVASIHDVAEDIDYPQDTDLILLMNSSNKVVGYIKPNADVKDQEVAPITATSKEAGRSYVIEFTLDQRTSNKRSPRFAFTLHLAGDAL